MQEQKITFQDCKYCGSKDLHWVTEQDGKFRLNEPYGLPHVCQAAKDHFAAIRKANSDHLKNIYAKEKERLSKLPDNTRCDVCQGVGSFDGFRYYKQRCSACYGYGAITQKVKSMTLFHLRKKLWPSMFNKGSK